jgi:hypothetical protein
LDEDDIHETKTGGHETSRREATELARSRELKEGLHMIPKKGLPMSLARMDAFDKQWSKARKQQSASQASSSVTSRPVTTLMPSAMQVMRANIIGCLQDNVLQFLVCLFNYFMTLSADRSDRSVYGTNCFRPLKRWGRGLESRSRMNVFIVCLCCPVC